MTSILGYGKASGKTQQKPSSSRIRDLIKFLSSVQGDLSNVTAPPFFLAPTSVVEVGHCWAQHPAVFSAPAFEPSPERRSLLVLKHILTSLRSQLYIGGGGVDASIKKPLNAFLGELFLAKWTDKKTGRSTRLVSEQVSHHPPITAMHISDEENGVRADGYARVEMGFNGNVDIKQIGHAVLHIDKYEEDYLIPLPDVRVRGFMSGRLYPEIKNTYHIVGSNGFVSEIKFAGAGLAWGTKNGFTARLYHKSSPEETLYEVDGSWSSGWTVKDSRTGETVEKYHLDDLENAPAEVEIAPLEDQDPWESRRAWASVREAIQNNDFRAVVREKSKVEQAQRDMRSSEKERGKAWKPLLFSSLPGSEYKVFHDLAAGFSWDLHDDRTKGVWRFHAEKLDEMRKPFRRELTPDGS